MGRYFPLFGEEWGVYFFARKSLVSGATVARIVDGIRDGSVVQDTLPWHRSTRGDFSGLGEPSIASPRQTSKLRSVSQRDGTSARATSTPRGAIFEREYLFLYLFISLLEIYQDVLSVALLSVGNAGRLGKFISILEILFSNRASVFADLAFPSVWRV